MKQDPVYAELSHSTDGPAPPPPVEQEPVQYATMVITLESVRSHPEVLSMQSARV